MEPTDFLPAIAALKKQVAILAARSDMTAKLLAQITVGIVFALEEAEVLTRDQTSRAIDAVANHIERTVGVDG